MRPLLRVGCAAAVGGGAAAGGCVVAPPVDNPVLVRTAGEVENPVLVSPGVPTAVSYAEVFEKTLDILDDYFVLRPPNRYEGRIDTVPRIAPGYEQFFKAGNPDPRERLLATFQTIRQIATVEIRAAERGGYLILVVVEKEQEDIPRPARSTLGAAAFRDTPSVDREVEVIGAETTASRGWYKIGRDYAFEQVLLQRIRNGK